MQMRRTSKTDGSVEKDTHILIEKSEVILWVEDEMSVGARDLSIMSAGEFLDIVGRRSGLFLPRGEDRYAFVHLSFQEYFAAVAIEQEVTSLSWAKGETSRLGLERQSLKRLAYQNGWFETFSFLFELLSSRGDWHQELLDVVFGKKFSTVGRKVKWASNEKVLNASRLLTRLISNPLSGLKDRDKKVALKSTVRSIVRFGFEPNFGSSLVFNELFRDDEAWNIELLRIICSEVVDQESYLLDLSDTNVSNLSPISGAKCLTYLDLDRTRVTDIGPLE